MPHRELTPFEWRELIATHLASWGNAYLAIERNQAGSPVYLDPLDPSRCTPKKLTPSEANPSGRVYQVSLDSGEQKDFTSYDVLHIPGLGFDGLKGVGPIGVARQAAAAGIAMEKYALQLFESGSLQGGIIKTEGDISQSEAAAVKEQWKQKASGLNNAHEPMVLWGGLEFTPTTINPKDSQFIEERGFQSAEIFKLFGLNEKGVPEEPHNWLKFTLLPYLRRIEERLSRLLPRGTFAEFLTEGILRADLPIRYAAYGVGLTQGFLTVNEVRDAETLPHIEGGDEAKPLGPNIGTPPSQVLPPGSER